MGPAYKRIVSSTFDIPDPDKEYARIRATLKLGTRASRADYGEMVDALDEAEETTMAAMELYIHAKVALEDYEIYADMRGGAMREQAITILQSAKADLKKDSGTSGKQITDADVRMTMARIFPEEYRALEKDRSQNKHTVDLIKELVERCRERCRDLRSMVGKARDA